MAIITLTTDLGSKDFYQAALKGSILSILPTANIVDVTHEVPSFNISYAAFVLKNVYPYFPKGTVHLIGIDSVFSENTRYIALKYRDHFFVGADNGIFSLLFEEIPEEIVELNIMQDLKYLHFPLVDIFVKAAIHLAKGGRLKDIGMPTDSIEERMLLNPVIERDIIRGSVIYIDTFSNVITNITKELFTKIQRNRDFTLYFRKSETITQLSWHYNEVPEGEKLCLFGISNHLEIAINKGKASGLLGLHLNDIIRIEFHP
ncbi:SAM-dependent chlorinase/fluorinase [Pedobacter sp. N36a]|uniref:SAM hydrolase/SAM-dependent halogenase family protein n=1 Tax=Pedobacter sp. N36a TaxID=2767996 RepID=UPI001656EAC9|nr:SAM-dependent chlorinase/fluorinase [Pedobacter sp. N36a]MBC8986602.1 SAM-dependent chlorinase/fluorinase [Pedobacter sp. N36a]